MKWNLSLGCPWASVADRGAAHCAAKCDSGRYTPGVHEVPPIEPLLPPPPPPPPPEQAATHRMSTAPAAVRRGVTRALTPVSIAIPRRQQTIKRAAYAAT